MPALSGIGTNSVQITSTYTPAPYGVQFRASPSNTGTVFIGYSNSVTAGNVDATDGMPLAAGDSYFVPPSLLTQINSNATLSTVWVIANTASQKIFYEILTTVSRGITVLNVNSLITNNGLGITTESGIQLVTQ